MIKLLKKWLKEPGNSKARLAAILGYKTSASIDVWIKNNKIPGWVEARLNEILRG